MTPKAKGRKSVYSIFDQGNPRTNCCSVLILRFQPGGYEYQTREAIFNESGIVRLHLGELITLWVWMSTLTLCSSFRDLVESGSEPEDGNKTPTPIKTNLRLGMKLGTAAQQMQQQPSNIKQKQLKVMPEKQTSHGVKLRRAPSSKVSTATFIAATKWSTRRPLSLIQSRLKQEEDGSYQHLYGLKRNRGPRARYGHFHNLRSIQMMILERIRMKFEPLATSACSNLFTCS